MGSAPVGTRDSILDSLIQPRVFMSKGCYCVVLALSLPTGACSREVQRTQLSPPFGVRPILPGQKCAPEYQKILKLQLEAYKALQRLTRRDGEKLCASVE